MKRTRQATSMMEPEIYRLIQTVEPNVSVYLYELACADLIRRGTLTIEKLMEIQDGTLAPEPSTPLASAEV
jgi:hypothetical protein